MAAIAALFWAAGPAQADDLNASGNLIVAGTGNFQGGAIYLGVGGTGQPASMIDYNALTDSAEFILTGSASYWTWAIGSGTQTTIMDLDANGLAVYPSTGGTAAGPTVFFDSKGDGSALAKSISLNGTNNQMPNQP